MAQDFAKKGWTFAQRQNSQATTQHSPFSVGPAPQRRSYSTLTPSSLNRDTRTFVSFRGTRGFSNHTADDGGGGGVAALVTGDVGKFPQKLREIRSKLLSFMEEVVYPTERTLMDHQMSGDRWKPHPIVEEMKVCMCVCIYHFSAKFYVSVVLVLIKSKAKGEGLWNLFLPLESDPSSKFGAGLSNLEYSHLAEIMGRSLYASEVSRAIVKVI